MEETVGGQFLDHLRRSPLPVQIAAGAGAGVVLMLYALGWLDERLDEATAALDTARADANEQATIERLERKVTSLQCALDDLILLMKESEVSHEVDA